MEKRIAGKFGNLFTISKIKCFMRYLPAIIFWPVAGIVTVSAAWFFLFLTLDNERHSAESAGYDTAAKIAMNEANQIRKSALMLDQTILLVRAHATALARSDQLELFMHSIVPPSTFLDIEIFDLYGASVYPTPLPNIGTLRETNVSKLPFFFEQQQSKKDILYVSVPEKRIHDDVEIVRYSRKIFDESGGFAGVVSVALEGGAFSATDSRANLGDTGFVIIVGDRKDADGFLLMSGQPPTASMIASLPNIHSSSKGSSYSLLKHGRQDGQYFVSWNSLANSPLTVVSGVERKVLFASYDDRENAVLQTATAASVVMLAFIAAATALTARLELQRYRLKEAQLAYRTATEQGAEGFFIVRPLRDGAGAIVDYVTIDCNERGANFLHRAREGVVGEELSSFGALIPFDLVMKKFSEAVRSGYAKFELRITQERRDGPLFMSATAARSDGILAVTLRDVTLEKRQFSALERQTNEDPLTGLPNRAWLTKMLPEFVASAAERKKMLAVLFVDLDGFKCVNDTFGHATGDELLMLVSKRLNVAVRPEDCVARIGGDEFIVVLEELTCPTEADAVAGRIVDAFQQPFAVSKGIVTVGTSIGISVFPLDASDPDSLLRHSDLAMYAVKTGGKNRYQHFDQALFTVISMKAQLECELRTAIKEKQFVMHYQPRVDLATGAVCSMEALVRWNHPVDGVIGPDRFIHVAEETGLILDLGDLIIDIVCSQLALWAQSNCPVLPVSINVSSRQFNEMDIHASFVAALAKHKVGAASVEIELTESTMLNDTAKASDCLHALHKLGISLLVDDFGTGYSSLSMLQELDFDILKVDKSFTQRLGADRQGEVFFNAIVTMAHALGMRVIAEGVENHHQLEILHKLGCDEVQGFFLFRPRLATVDQALMWSEN